MSRHSNHPNHRPHAAEKLIKTAQSAGIPLIQSVPESQNVELLSVSQERFRTRRAMKGLTGEAPDEQL